MITWTFDVEAVRADARALAKAALEESLFGQPWEKWDTETRALITNLCKAIYDGLDRENVLEESRV